jgi:small subunit ribosomal protein S9
MAEATHYHYALGRRKEAIATVRLYPGKGEIIVNDMPAADYFNNDSLIAVLERGIKLAGQDGKLKVSLHVKGGGKRGQADAASLGIARALNVMTDDQLRPTLKKAGLLTRDPREKERMKPGLKKARKAPQFSKR